MHLYFKALWSDFERFEGGGGGISHAIFILVTRIHIEEEGRDEVQRCFAVLGVILSVVLSSSMAAS